VQALFDAADGRAEEIRARGRKGALAALRDAAVLKTVYAYGLRRREASGLDLADLRHNPKAPQYGQARRAVRAVGQGVQGQPARRRTVLTVPEMDWITGVLSTGSARSGRRSGRGRWRRCGSPSGAGRLSARAVDDAFTAASRAAGLDPVLDLHCLRHSYITHLVEFDYPERFVSEQAGHPMPPRPRSTPGCRTSYRSRLVRRSLETRPERGRTRCERGRWATSGTCGR
jgi:site-specific recombinase XerC